MSLSSALPSPRLAVLVLLAVLPGCATVKMQRLREDYEQVDRQRVKRLVVVTAPLPEGGTQVAELFSLIARRDINLKRNFLVKEGKTSESAEQLSAHCGEGLEGVLHLRPSLERREEDVRAELFAQLLRCSDGAEVWAARSKGTWDQEDAHVRELSATYANELGPEVLPYVPAAFHILRATIETLPDPVLGDDDIAEKIELGD